MKTFLRLSFLFMFFVTINLFSQVKSGYQFPTFAEPPGPENVLVVYNELSEISVNIMLHYMDVRDIPFSTHKVPISLPDPLPIGITVENDGEIIRGEGLLAWNFVKEEIADEIEYHLNTTYYNGELLRDLIRYIVLCKGMPLKIDDINSFEETKRTDVSVDALLCLINQEPGKHFTQLYGTSITALESNPYYDADETYTLDYRFVSNQFITVDGWKLQYLVSRLDGRNLQEIKNMIDNAFIADQTGDKTWILDHDPDAPGTGHISSTFIILI